MISRLATSNPVFWLPVWNQVFVCEHLQILSEKLKKKKMPQLNASDD